MAYASRIISTGANATSTRPVVAYEDHDDDDDEYDYVEPPSPPIQAPVLLPPSAAAAAPSSSRTTQQPPPMLKRSNSASYSKSASARPAAVSVSASALPHHPHQASATTASAARTSTTTNKARTAGSSSNSGVGRRTSSSSSFGGQGSSHRAGGGGGSSSSKNRIGAMQPPKHPELVDTEEQWKAQSETMEKNQGWHHLPLFLVVLPPLGAIIHGRAENWSDGIVIMIICFYLYQLIKVPWDIYYASHARVVLDATLPKPGQEGYDPQQAERRDHSVRQLRRTELGSLLMTMLVPAIGGYFLHYARGLLSDPDRYINNFLISMFALATSVKPILHFSSLVQKNSLYHQEQVWYPSTEVHFLRRRVEALEKDLSQLTRAFATKADVRNLRDGVDVPLSQLSKAVRRFDRKEEFLRLTSEERFSILEQKLEVAAQERIAQNSLIEQLRFEAHNANLVQQVVQALRFTFLGQYRGQKFEQRQLKWFEKGPLFWLFLPVNGPRLAIEYISTSGTDIISPTTKWSDQPNSARGIGSYPFADSAENIEKGRFARS